MLFSSFLDFNCYRYVLFGVANKDLSYDIQCVCFFQVCASQTRDEALKGGFNASNKTLDIVNKRVYQFSFTWSSRHNFYKAV